MIGCALLAGCAAQPETIDVTPHGAASESAVALEPLAPERFDGVPTRIGFASIPLEGGDFPGLTDFVFLPGGSEFLAINRTGLVGHFRLEGDHAMLDGSFQIPVVYSGGSCGASAIALDPDFVHNRLFYVGYCLNAEYVVIKRFTAAADAFSETLYTAANIYVAGDIDADSAQNVIGSMVFGSDGMLWVTLGDHRRDANAQNTANDFGKVLRLLPRKGTTESGFDVPTGNMGLAQAPLVYALGVRNPWRGAFDAGGRFWVADSGGSAFEEIDLVTGPGQNMGWPAAEGPLCRVATCSMFEQPLRSWDRSEDHAFIRADALHKDDIRFRAAWVAPEYVPGVVDPYKGLLTRTVLYGDFYAGFVRGIIVDDGGNVVRDGPLGHLELPVAWRQGEDGYLYAGTLFASFDHARTADGDPTLTSQMSQGGLWRVVPLP